MQLFTHLLSSYLQGMGDFFSALLYREGVCISALLLRNNMEPLWESFDDFIGNDGKSWNEGLPYESTKDIPLTMMFHHLYDHTLWSLADIIKIQHFNVVLSTTFEKTI